jgi:hypothetical protein
LPSAARGNIHENLLLQRQIRNKTLQTDILAFRVRHPLRLVNLSGTREIKPKVNL